VDVFADKREGAALLASGVTAKWRGILRHACSNRSAARGHRQGAVRAQEDVPLDLANKASASFGADLTQRSARVFTLAGKRLQLGRAALPWSLRATGRGERSEATTPVSQHFVSGDLGVVDAVRRT
jgi:hypothetical protein